jgi:hypothetical protein
MSHDVEETKPAEPVILEAIPQIEEPLTREEREFMNDLSYKAYGAKNQWKKLLKSGELKEENVLSNKSNKPMIVKRVYHLTVDQIRIMMEKVISDKEIAAEKAKQGEKNETTQESNEVTEKA